MTQKNIWHNLSEVLLKKYDLEKVKDKKKEKYEVAKISDKLGKIEMRS